MDERFEFPPEVPKVGQVIRITFSGSSELPREALVSGREVVWSHIDIGGRHIIVHFATPFSNGHKLLTFRNGEWERVFNQAVSVEILPQDSAK